VKRPLNVWTKSLDLFSSTPWRGTVTEANGQWLEAKGLLGDIGDICEIRPKSGEVLTGEVVGFRQERMLIMLFEAGKVRFGDEVIGTGRQSRIGVGPALLGRVVNALGSALDGRGPIPTSDTIALHRSAHLPFDRVPINRLYTSGIRAIDGMLSMGEGQRVGIFGGSGVGKSTIINMFARSCIHRICVIGLIGERGREVAEITERTLGSGQLEQTVIVVATSDQSPLLKLKAAEAATSIAEYFQGQGKEVLLIIDSLTRYAMAAREVGLANGEPPTSKGYTPSVFSRIAKLVERAGRFRVGCITAVYTVLMEGDDQEDPIVDAARSFLDGHFVLSRALALDGWYPPIDIISSVSRLMSSVVAERHAQSCGRVRRSMATFAKSEDLIRIGAYKSGTDPELDEAINMRPQIRAFLQQSPAESAPLDETMSRLEGLARR
jgi:flagellum-specific ATP synthase